MATLLKHVQEDPLPPSRRTELEIPVDLEAVVLACLAKDPTGRPQTAEDLDARLAACSVGEWTKEKAEEWWDLHRGDDGQSGGGVAAS